MAPWEPPAVDTGWFLPWEPDSRTMLPRAVPLPTFTIPGAPIPILGAPRMMDPGANLSATGTFSRWIWFFLMMVVWSPGLTLALWEPSRLPGLMPKSLI